MDGKIYLNSLDMTRDSFALARKIYDSGFLPEVIIALWRGGTPVGIAVHEFLHYKGVECYHTVVKTHSYTGIGEHDEPCIENMDYVIGKLGPHTRVLVVDDIFDSGATMRTVRARLSEVTDGISVATLYFKPSRNVTDFTPDFYLKETESWLVFPHELMGLTPEEIREKDPYIYSILGL